jgi:hypothetical protein
MAKTTGAKAAGAAGDGKVKGHGSGKDAPEKVRKVSQAKGVASAVGAKPASKPTVRATAAADVTKAAKATPKYPRCNRLKSSSRESRLLPVRLTP